MVYSMVLSQRGAINKILGIPISGKNDLLFFVDGKYLGRGNDGMNHAVSKIHSCAASRIEVKAMETVREKILINYCAR